MQILFKYDENMDMKCLLSKGAGSNNSPTKMTKTYELLVSQVDDLGDETKVKEFIRRFIRENNIDIANNLSEINKNWIEVANKFEEIATRIFRTNLNQDITAYLTITGRYPYDTKENYFYVSLLKTNTNATIMHELWHFYTYAKFGDYIDTIGASKYNDIKEALTVLLNIECKDLLGEEVDSGYPQHKDLREKITQLWADKRDIEYVWSSLQRQIEG